MRCDSKVAFRRAAARGAAVLALIATGIPARAGLCASGDAGEPHREFRLLAGYSPTSPTLIGTATDRQLAIAEFSYSYRCWLGSRVSLSFTAGVLPAVVVRQPQQTLTLIASPGVGFTQNLPAHAVYGFGFTPVGFFAEFARRHWIHPIAEVDGGIVASTEPIPLRGNNATGLNFLFDFGGGIRWNAGPRQAVTAGYRFLHISNAGTTDFNPGLDNHVFYLSYSFLR